MNGDNEHDDTHVDDDADVVDEDRVVARRMDIFADPFDMLDDAPRERTSKQNKRAAVFGSVKMTAAPPASSNDECKQS